MIKKHRLIKVCLLSLFLNISMILPAMPPAKNNKLSVKQFTQAARLMNQARKILAKGDHRDAISLLEKSIETYTDFSDGYALLARIYYQSGKYQKSLRMVVKARDTYLPMVRTLSSIQTLYKKKINSQKDDIKQKITSLRRYLSHRRGCTVPHMANDLNQLEEQMAAIDKQLARPSREFRHQIPPSFDYLAAVLKIKSGNHQDAGRHLELLIRESPMLRGESFALMAEIAYVQKKYEKALHFLNQAELCGMQRLWEFKDRITRTLASANVNLMEKEYAGSIQKFVASHSSNQMALAENIYVVFDQKSKDAVIIDPGQPVGELEKFISERDLKVKKILNTHGHEDHCGANGHYGKLYRVKIEGPRGDLAIYQQSKPENIPHQFFNGSTIDDVGTLKIKVIPTPGHTKGSVCFYVNGSLISGDTLFFGSIGRVYGADKAESARLQQLELASIRESLLKLPGSTIVLPGHGLDTSIEQEMKTNPFLAKILKSEKR